jgi:hypothetical protein
VRVANSATATTGTCVKLIRFTDNLSVDFDSYGAKVSASLDPHIHDDRYFTENEVTLKLVDKAEKVHAHDDRYFTEAEVDARLAAKADVVHDHPHKQAAIVNGTIAYGANGTYTANIGLTKNVSGLIPTGFTLVRAFATGYKADSNTGAHMGEAPLTFEVKVSAPNITLRVWDYAGKEYGTLPEWSSCTAQIEYTLLTQK